MTDKDKGEVVEILRNNSYDFFILSDEKLAEIATEILELDKPEPITPKERETAVNGFIKITVKHTLAFFRLMGFETHIEATVLDETTGETFEFSFTKKKP